MTAQTVQPSPGPSPAQQRQAEKKAAALTALRTYGTIERAAEAAGVSRTTVYRWREADPAFEAEVKQWMDEDMEAELAATLFTIAKLGMTDAKYANAAVRAAELLIKAENRAKYGDHQQIEQTVSINQTVQVIHEVRDQMRERQQEKLKQLRTVDMEVAVLPST